MWPEFGAAVKLVWFAGDKKLSYRVQWRKLEKLKQRIDSTKHTSARADGGHDPRTPDLGHLLLTLLLKEHGSLEEDCERPGENRIRSHITIQHNQRERKSNRQREPGLHTVSFSFQLKWFQFKISCRGLYPAYVLLYFIRTAAWSQIEAPWADFLLNTISPVIGLGKRVV